MYELPWLGDESRLTASGQIEHDDLRGTVGTGMLAVRIPFGPGGSSNRPLSPLEWRMVAPIVRDVDIITRHRIGPAEPAKLARTGLPISQALVIDANTPDPRATILAAGPNSVVVVDGSAGIVRLSDTLPLQSGQTLVGGGSVLAVAGCRTGVQTSLVAPGMRGRIHSNNPLIFDPLVFTANHATIQGLELFNLRRRSPAVLLHNHIGVQISDVQLTTLGPRSHGIDALGTSEFTVEKSNIFVTGAAAVGIRAQGNSRFRVTGGTIATGPGSAGVFARSSAGNTLSLALDNVEITSGGSGVLLDGSTFAAGTINATIQNTAFNNAGANSITGTTAGSSTLCLNAFNNTSPNGMNAINLGQTGASQVRVTQTSAADLSDKNSHAAFFSSGTILFGQPACPTP